MKPQIFTLRGPARFYHAMWAKKLGATVEHVREGKGRYALRITKEVNALDVLKRWK